MWTVQIPSYNYLMTVHSAIQNLLVQQNFYSFHYHWTKETDVTGMLNMGCDCLCHCLVKLKGLKCVAYYTHTHTHTHTLQVQSFLHCALIEVSSCNLYTYNMLVFAKLHSSGSCYTHTHTPSWLKQYLLWIIWEIISSDLSKDTYYHNCSLLCFFSVPLSTFTLGQNQCKPHSFYFILMNVQSFNTELLTVLLSKLQTQIYRVSIKSFPDYKHLL